MKKEFVTIIILLLNDLLTALPTKNEVITSDPSYANDRPTSAQSFSQLSTSVSTTTSRPTHTSDFETQQLDKSSRLAEFGRFLNDGYSQISSSQVDSNSSSLIKVMTQQKTIKPNLQFAHVRAKETKKLRTTAPQGSNEASKELPTTRHRRIKPKKVIDQVDNETGNLQTRRQPTHKSTTQPLFLINSAETSRRITRRKHRHKSTTPRLFVVDSEVLNKDTLTEGVIRPFENVLPTRAPINNFQPSSSTASNLHFTIPNHDKLEVSIVDGEAGALPNLYPFNFATTQKPTNRSGVPDLWSIFITLPPKPLPMPTIRPAFVDYAPNCLSNTVLCQEDSIYGKFMRTYCQKTCADYDNLAPQESTEMCEDLASNCGSLQKNCFVRSSPYYMLLKRNCRRTCQFCMITMTKSSADLSFPMVESVFNKPKPPPFVPHAILQTPEPVLLKPQLQTDVEPLYSAGECQDIGPNCGQFLAQCNNASVAFFMSRYCAASCNFCVPCEDSSPEQCNELIRKGFCESPNFRLAIKKLYCKRSCNLCESAPNMFPGIFVPNVQI